MKALDGSNYTIAGVFVDLPLNVHLRFNGLLSAAAIEEQIGSELFNDRSADSFWNVSSYSYILMAENTNPGMVLEKFPDLYDKYMASFNPVSVLKGNGASKRYRGALRKGLVTAQFFISSMMIIGSIIVALQMGFTRKMTPDSIGIRSS